MLYNKDVYSALMLVNISKEILNTPDRKGLIDNIVESGEKYSRTLNNLDVRYSGMPYLRTIDSIKVKEEVSVFILLTLLITSLILYIFFRSFKATLISMIVVTNGVLFSFGLMGILEYDITALTALVPPVVIVIGIPNCIYLINKYHTEFRKNNSTQNKILPKDKTTLFENTKDKDELNIIIKSDVQGSSEALKMAITKIDHKEVEAKIILSDIGMINETDVSLAKASNAILIGFNVKPNREAKKLAEEQKIDIKYFNIIYEAIDYVEKSLSGLLEPDIKETVLGSAEIQKVFKVSTAGKIAGSKVISGEIKSKSKARIIRDGVVVYSGEILSIFREKNQVKEVGTGLECGISIKDFIDFKEKDVIESYLSEEVQRSI